MDRQFTMDYIPLSQQGIFKKAYEGKSKKAIINAKCLDCCCFQREEVKNCTVASCPIWKVRPYQVELAKRTRKTSTPEKENT